MRIRSLVLALAVALPVVADAQNVALGRPTVASSTYPFGIADDGPENAVDGNTDGNYFAGSLFHSGTQSGDWWYVDLGAAYDIDQIDYWNRTDGFGHRTI